MLYFYGMNNFTTTLEHFGGAAATARALGVTTQAVWQWASGARNIPVQRCVQIEQLTKGAVSRRDLRPNDWKKIWPELERKRAA